MAHAKANGAMDLMVPAEVRTIAKMPVLGTGKIDFVDNVINQSTGTIRGRAVFDNADGLFTPGMFGRVRVPGSPVYNALLVPDAAIGTEQIRKFVMVVGADNAVTNRYVTLGQLSDGLRVVKEGLTADDRVIVNGLMRARSGQKVTPQEQQPGAAQPQPWGQEPEFQHRRWIRRGSSAG